MWLNTCEVKPQRLAIKFFSIIPSSAACERMFLSLGWLYGKCRTRLGIDQLDQLDQLEGLAKIYRFNLSNSAEQFHQNQTEVSPESMKRLQEQFFNELEEEVFSEELENIELPNPAEHLYINEPDLNLNISDVINLQPPIFHSTGIHFNNNEREVDEDESSDNDDELRCE
ncbi:hypothetical protein C1645_809635 [Glomus cerebriforme]|uniref:HAT C-terminal dimerisation domain-containing protein n=1 Tax=Glomus cerebriforme TaxID=658196 RepID=A0A397S7S9_9GLOM|nr:hypothetical protein C1645_809635 [Glomus cerebriforme]